MTVFTFHFAKTKLGTTMKALCRPPAGRVTTPSVRLATPVAAGQFSIALADYQQRALRRPIKRRDYDENR